MPKEKSQAYGIHIGSSTLLTVFLILCLVTFAVLSLVSARSDYSFSQKTADRKTAYYQASNQAEEVLEALDTLFEETYQENSASFVQSVEKALTHFSVNDIKIVSNFQNGESVISYQVPLDERQVLAVSLRLCAAPEEENCSYHILTWQVKNNAEWNNDQTLHLLPINQEGGSN